MARKGNAPDPFDIINSELSGGAGRLPRIDVGNTPQQPPQNAPQSTPSPENAAARQQGQQTQAADEAPSEGSGCGGYIVKGLVIIVLAVMLAWIIFMPSGSLAELKDHLINSLFPASTAVSRTTDDTPSAAETFATPSDTAATTAAKAAAKTVAATATTAKRTTAATKRAATTTVSSAAAEESDSQDSPYYIYVYLQSQILTVYDIEDDEVVTAFVCSTGKSSTPTKTGDYRIRSKYRWRLMIGNCYTQYASSFSSGYLFHSIPYNRKNAATMSNASYDKLGTPASSGCVRLCFRDSKWIYDNCPIGTFVRVVDTYAPTDIVPQTIFARINDTAHSGWDPTDTDPNNPYNNE